MERIDVIELHIAVEEQNRDEQMQKLSEFCELNGFDTVRLFWRGFEPDDEMDE